MYYLLASAASCTAPYSCRYNAFPPPQISVAHRSRLLNAMCVLIYIYLDDFVCARVHASSVLSVFLACLVF